jgi:hydrogenase-4 component B
MSGALLPALFLTPLLVAALVAAPATRRWAEWLAPWAALPALLAALLAPPDLTLDLPWLLLGARFALDDTGRLFLLFTALLWLVGGLYARGYLAADPRRAGFTALFLVTQAGNLGLCLAMDAASFYLAFAVMTFASYGLVVHDRSAEAWRAGRIYLILAIVGEVLLLTGLLLLSQAAGTLDLAIAPGTLADHPRAALITVFLLLGFGVKAGLPLLHVWLPLAHPVAPTPASAVLSGAMIKAGLLGWLRFLPLGVVALPEWGTAVMALGLIAAFGGVLAGLTQDNPKTVLAYSSISQMGFMTLGVGAGLLRPDLWPALATAVALYALHHGLAKGALFLGVGVLQRAGDRPWLDWGLLLPVLALAGAPSTSGALAKAELKAALIGLPAPWPVVLNWGLPLAALGTTLLMARFLWTLHRDDHAAGNAWPLIIPWLGLLLAVAGLAWWLAPEGAFERLLHPTALWSAAWPFLAGATLALLASRRTGWIPTIPAGDLLVPVERALAVLWARRPTLHPPHWPRWHSPLTAADRERLETDLRAWPVTGILFLVGLAAFLAAITLK